MSDHLLPITPGQLSRLPDGVLVDGWGRTGHGPYGSASEREVLEGLAGVSPLHLVMDDLVTRAVVAVMVVDPYVTRTESERTEEESAAIGHLMYAALMMRPMTADQIETLARLARAALEAR